MFTQGSHKPSLPRLKQSSHPQGGGAFGPKSGFTGVGSAQHGNSRPAHAPGAGNTAGNPAMAEHSPPNGPQVGGVDLGLFSHPHSQHEGGTAQQSGMHMLNQGDVVIPGDHAGNSLQAPHLGAAASHPPQSPSKMSRMKSMAGNSFYGE